MKKAGGTAFSRAHSPFCCGNRAKEVLREKRMERGLPADLGRACRGFFHIKFVIS